MALESCREAARLRSRLRALDDERSELKARLDDALERAASELVEENLPRLAVDGELLHFTTVAHVSPQPGVTPERIKRALARLGLAELMPPRLNQQGLGAHVRELVEEGKPVPPALKKLFRVDVHKELRIRAEGVRRKPITAEALDEALGEGRIE